jgi:hypothetical protein
MDGRGPSQYSVEGCLCALETRLLWLVSGVASFISLAVILLLDR